MSVIRHLLLILAAFFPLDVTPFHTPNAISVTTYVSFHPRAAAYHVQPRSSVSVTTYVSLKKPHSSSSDEDEVFSISERPADEPLLTEDLSPPLINLRKESILFGENPATQRNNNSLKFWTSLKTQLPRVVTGARTPTTGDSNPIGALYNIVFVRVPILVAGLVYTSNLFQGHPLVVDFGEGPFVVGPLIVYGLFYLLLR